MTSPDLIRRAADQLEASSPDASVLIGFDGFIDEIIRLVDTRHSVDSYDPIPSIAAFGKRILAASGLSANIEMVPEQVKLGGNGPIMANNLVEQGYRVNYCGALGADGVVDPVFAEFAERCEQVISLSAPGHTDAVEFDDGKIMLGKMNSLPQVNWDSLLAQISEEDLLAKLNSMKLIGCVNWTMLPEMNSILTGLGSLLARCDEAPTLFIDLTDPAKRSTEDLLGVLEILSSIQKHCNVVLGLNENESRQVSAALFKYEGDDLTTRAEEIRSKLGLTQVLVHPTRSAGVATAEGSAYVEGPYCQKPKLTTGAGDNFNAGYCNGLLSGLEPELCLICGVCSSGFYVRNCRSATRPEMIAFMRQWAEADGAELP